MNFLDSLSSALFSGLGGAGGAGGSGGSDFLSPIASMLDPAGKSEGPAGSLSGIGPMSGLGAAGGPMSGLGLIGGLLGGGGGALGGSPLISAFRDALGGGGGKDALDGGTGADPMAGGAPGSAPGSGNNLIPGLSAMAGNPGLMDAAKSALPATSPPAASPASGMSPSPSPSQALGMTPDTAQSAYPEPGAQPGTFLGKNSKDWRDIIQAVFAGAAGVNPNSPGLSAFAQGGAGTFKAFDKQSAANVASKNATEDRLWKREDRGIAADDRQFKRGMETSKDARAERDSDVKNVASLSKVMNGIKSMNGLTMEQKFKVNDQLYRYADKINKSGLMSPEDLDTAIGKERDRLLVEYGVRSPDGAVGKVPPAAGQQQSGDGASSASPSKPTSRESFDTLPSGAWFVNPADGKVMQKQ